MPVRHGKNIQFSGSEKNSPYLGAKNSLPQYLPNPPPHEYFKNNHSLNVTIGVTILDNSATERIIGRKTIQNRLSSSLCMLCKEREVYNKKSADYIF